jgi:L-alanine-DL-glutamate epimerase-like enolase superfamily enzyme
MTAQPLTYAIRGVFRISRGAKTRSDVIEVEIRDGELAGRGECVPYLRYGQTLDGVLEQIRAAAPLVADGVSIAELQDELPAGPARNAIECALWDLQARQGGPRCSDLFVTDGGVRPLTTAFTISLDSPEAMAKVAVTATASGLPVLKLKLGGEGDVERVRAVRAAVPGARLIADANESWTPGQLAEFTPVLANLRLELIEQPLPAGDDGPLSGFASPVPLSADEACHDRSSLAALVGKYDYITVKLDKTGGPTEAAALLAEARRLGFGVMVGCMVASSLSMAPGVLAAQQVPFVHLDGPLLLARDRDPGLRYDGARVPVPAADVWAC